MDQRIVIHPNLQSERGFSIVTALVVVAIVSIIAAALAKLINDSIVVQNQVDNRMSTQTLRLAMIERLSERATCNSSLAGRNPLDGSGAPITQIRNSPGTIFFQSSAPGGVTYENNKLRINRFFFQTNPTHTFREFFSGAREGSLDLFVEVAPVLTGAGGLESHIFIVKLIVQLDPSNNISTCVAVGNDSDDIWRLNAASEVFYNGGHVGIGTNNPNFDLHVIGNMRSTGTISAGERVDAPLIVAPGTLGNVVAHEMRGERFLYTSDRGLKDNIQEIKDFHRLLKLQGVSFRWKTDGHKAMGLIAQDVEKVFPSAVSQDAQTGTKSIDYAQLLPLIVENLKELHAKNVELEKQLLELEVQCKK